LICVCNMKIVKKQIVSFLIVMMSIIMVHKHCFAYDAEKVEELPVREFWDKVDSKWTASETVTNDRTSDNGTYRLEVSSGSKNIEKATALYNTDDTAFKGCEVLPVKLYNNRKCFFCSLITIMYAASNHITSISFDTFAMPFAVVMAIGLAIWIAIKVLDFVSSVSKQDAPKFLTELMKQSYKVMIAFFLLLFSGQIFDYIILDVLDAGLKFGGEVVSYASTDGDMKNAIVDSKMLMTTDLNVLEEQKLNLGIKDRAKQFKLPKTKGRAYYDVELYTKIDNFIVFVQKNIAFVQSVGTSLLCIGGRALIFRGDVLTWGDGFQLVIMGLLLAGFSFLMILSFAFYLVDAVVQLGIVGALLPFMIATWPFKITSKYSKIGWNMVLNSAFVFLFSGMVTAVSIALIDSAMTYVANEAPASEEVTEESKKGGLYDLATAINTQSEIKVAELTDISGTGFLILLFCCVYALQFMGKASDLAGKFAGGALKPIAPGIATMAGSATKSFALKSTQHAREAISEKFKNGRRALWGGIKSIFKRGDSDSDPQTGGANPPSAGWGGGSPSSSPTNSPSGSPSATPGINSTQSTSRPTISEGGVKRKPVISEDDKQEESVDSEIDNPENPIDSEIDNPGNPVVSEVGEQEKTVVPENKESGETISSEENVADKINNTTQNKKTSSKRQTNADLSNLSGSKKRVEIAKQKYERINKSRKSSVSSKSKRKPMKTNKPKK